MLLSLLKHTSAWSSRKHVPDMFEIANDLIFCLRAGGLFRLDGVNKELRLEPVSVNVKRAGARSKEEEMLAERMRTSFEGIASIRLHVPTNRFFGSGHGTIFTLDMNGVATEIPSGAAGARLHTALSSDGQRMGFVRNRNIFLADVETGKEVKVSDANGVTVMAGEGN
jgi:hypothetical protein